MTAETTLTIGLIAAGFAAVLYFLNQKLTQLAATGKDNEAMKVMSDWMKQTLDQVQQTRQEMQKQLNFSGKAINERLDNAATVIGKVSKELGEMSEIGRQMKDLQDFLKSPKLRGNIGEQVLRDLLEQMIPKENFSLQHAFRNGTVVDAAIRTDKGIIPIDSKFPMENFKAQMAAKTEKERRDAHRSFVRDVKKHIDDIAKKYILPEEGTVDFALMYIPSEPVAYEIAVNISELADYAHRKRVVCVSPNQFNYFLKVILIGLEGKKIEEKARFILNSLKAVEADTERFGEDFRVLLKHINNAKNIADSASNSFRQLQSRISSVRNLQEPTKPPQLPLSENTE